MQVGTTAIAFSGDMNSSTQRIAVHAPQVDLADFNGYFNSADTLGGRGHVAIDAVHSGPTVNANGNVLITDARYRRFNVGTVAAAWQSAGRTVHGTGTVQTTHGSIIATSDITFPATDPLRDFRHRATFAAAGSLADLDLAQWLPAAGITLPILGIVNGSASATGTLAAPAFGVTATAKATPLVRGYPLSAFTFAANGDGAGAHISALHLAGPALTADVSGTFGYGAHAPVALRLFAQSDDLGVLAKSLGAKLDIGGAFSTTADLTGTRSAPQITADTARCNESPQQENTRCPNCTRNSRPIRKTVQLQAFEASLERGRLIATGTFPFRLNAPLTIPDNPFTATMRAEGIELAQFAKLLSGGHEARRHDRRRARRERNGKRSRHQRHVDARRRELFFEHHPLGVNQRPRADRLHALGSALDRRAHRYRRRCDRRQRRRHDRRLARSAAQSRL